MATTYVNVKDLLVYHRWTVYGLMGLAGFLYFEGRMFGVVSELDTCYSDRFTVQAQQASLWEAHRTLSSFIFRASVCAVFVFLALLVGWSEDKSNSAEFYKPRLQWNWNTFFGAGYLVLWYGSTYALLTAMKVIMGDYLCGGNKSNSISGHFSFFYFYGVSLPYLALILLPYDNARVTISNILNPRSTFDFKLTLLALAYVSFLFSGLFTLSQTWSWGYHSMRQILYGIVFGLVSHLALRHMFKKASSTMTRSSPPSIPSRLPADANEFYALVDDFFPVSCLALFNAAGLALAILISFSFPFTIYELLGFFTIWPSLIHSFINHQRGRFSSHSQLD